MKICKIKNCRNKYHAKGYCGKHYRQVWLYGKTFERTKYDRNKTIDCKDYCEICLYKKGKKIATTKIDKSDLEGIKDYRWWLDSNGYVTTKTNSKKVRLHRLLMNTPENFVTDHINHNILDNRKQNLRIVTQSQNCMNRKDVKGYYWRKNINKWQVLIKINQKGIRLGCFKKEKDAIQARKNAEQQYFGEFAYKLITT